VATAVVEDSSIRGDDSIEIGVSSLSGASSVSTNVTRPPHPPQMPHTPIRRTPIARTVEGAQLDTLSPTTAVSVPITSTRRRINLATSEDHSDEESNGGYDSNGAIGPFFDAIAGRNVHVR